MKYFILFSCVITASLAVKAEDELELSINNEKWKIRGDLRYLECDNTTCCMTELTSTIPVEHCFNTGRQITSVCIETHCWEQMHDFIRLACDRKLQWPWPNQNKCCIKLKHPDIVGSRYCRYVSSSLAITPMKVIILIMIALVMCL